MDTHETNDLWLASYLITEGINLVDIKADNRGSFNRAVFILSGDKINELVSKYKGAATCNVMDLKYNFTLLKQRMFKILDKR